MLERDFEIWSNIINGYSRNKHDYQVLAALLKSCAALSAVKSGKAFHSFVVKLGHLHCQSVSKALLNMYAKCGALNDCQKLFGQMGKSDSVTWNIVLSGFSGLKGNDANVMGLFNAMRVANHPKPSCVTIAIILPVCARLGDLDAGKIVHSYVIKYGLETHTLVGNAFISMYAKCGLVCDDAYAAFNSINHKDVVSWNAIIAGFSESKLMDSAFSLFRWMLKGPIEPNIATIANILPVCASLDKNVGYCFGKEIHCYVLRRTELELNLSISNALVSFYLRVGQMEEAESLFRRIKSRDLVSWNALIAGFASNGEWLKALDLFHELLSQDMTGPNSVTFISVLTACAQLQNLQVGEQIHGHVVRHPCLCDTAVWNALVNFYVKSNNIEAAYRTFLLISSRDLISWNSMLNGFAESRYFTHFLDILHWMIREGHRPDSITMLSIVHFCVAVSSVEMVKETHGFSIKASLLVGDFEPTIGNAILDAYAKCGNVDYASRTFQSLLGKKNLVKFNSIISGYHYCGSHDDAFKIFNDRSAMDITTWNLMIRVYAENDRQCEALSLFHELQAGGIKPDAVTIMSLLPVCTQMASVHLLRQCHGYVTRACFNDIRLNAALLDTYAKCGSIASAYKLFHSNHHKDLVMFTAMIGGYAMHGMGEEALKVFFHMIELGVKPDHVILTAVLSACSHAGLVDEGLKIFHLVEKVLKIIPTMEQYACVVDLLARAGRITDAYSFVTGMPIEANANVWGTLLGACRTHREVEFGRVVADRLFEIEANNIGNYVLMSNVYAADARWDAVVELRKLMRTRDLKKPAGCSWIEVETQRNIFVAGDSSHPQRSIIYSTLSVLDQQIKEASNLTN